MYNETSNDFVKSYLYEYGFLRGKDVDSLQSINATDLTNALLLFQEYYKLPADGELNNATRELMLKSRCGNEDNIYDFRTSAYKWNKTLVTWHYYLGTQEVLELTEKAFTLWEQKSNIRFKHDRMNPDILISNKRLKHVMQKESKTCTTEFNGKGGVLAHAFLPNYFNSICEIHIDEDENWSYSYDRNISLDQISLLATLTHEIGHALGLSHSDVVDSVMFAYYNGKIELADDDILAIENLYGKPLKTDSTPTSPLLPVGDNHDINVNEIDICHLKNINTFLVANKRLYILYEKWLWIINSNDMTYSNPVIITDWLTFLPKDFSKVLAAYQRPSGEIVMFIDSVVYMFDLTSLRLSQGYPKQLQSLFNIDCKQLHAVFNSYTGRTFIFHDDNYFREVDECTFTVKSWGYISDDFPGIPPKVDSSFRFTDGNLYFFKNNTVYVFNEFKGELIKTERNSLSIFGLKCLNDDILFQLKNLIQKLISQRKS